MRDPQHSSTAGRGGASGQGENEKRQGDDEGETARTLDRPLRHAGIGTAAVSQRDGRPSIATRLLVGIDRSSRSLTRRAA